MKRMFKTLAEAEREFNAAINDRNFWQRKCEMLEMQNTLMSEQLRWTKQMAGTLADTLYAGSREGTFPRRNA